MTERHDLLPDLIERAARLLEAEAWSLGLNPTQRAVLRYLSRANRFSRAPRHVTSFLGATKGTVSQTMKALARKGLLVERPNPHDRRSFDYELTDAGAAALETVEATAVHALPEATRDGLTRGITELLRRQVAATGGTLFGVCSDCRYHRRDDNARHCALLDVPLDAADAKALCHEFKPPEGV